MSQCDDTVFLFVSNSETEGEGTLSDFAGADIDTEEVVQSCGRFEVEVGRDHDILEVTYWTESFGQVEVEQVFNSTHLQVSEVISVKDDTHRIGFRKSDFDLGVEMKCVPARAGRIGFFSG